MYLLIGYFISVIVSGYTVYKLTTQDIIDMDGEIVLGYIVFSVLLPFIPVYNLVPVISTSMKYLMNTKVKFKITKEDK